MRFLLTDTPEEKPKSKRSVRPRCCEFEKCFYCEMPLIPSHDHDHFPKPFRYGGTDMVACCKNCHVLKDRIPLDRWPMNEVEVWSTMLDVWYKLTPPGRLLLAKMMTLTYDAMAEMHKDNRLTAPLSEP
jgi:hypothetical protein